MCHSLIYRRWKWCIWSSNSKHHICLLLRCQLHSESPVDGRSRERGGRRSRPLSQNSRRLLVLAESHQLLVTGHSQWPGMQTCFTKTSLLLKPREIFLRWLKPIACFQDCLRACQEQIESLLELNLRQAQLHGGAAEPKRVDGEVDLSCTPTDVRDVNIWGDWRPLTRRSGRS